MWVGGLYVRVCVCVCVWVFIVSSKSARDGWMVRADGPRRAQYRCYRVITRRRVNFNNIVLYIIILYAAAANGSSG